MRFLRFISSTFYLIGFLLLLLNAAPSLAGIDDQNKGIPLKVTPLTATPERYISRSALTDSLTGLLLAISAQQDSLRDLLKAQKITIKEGELIKEQLTEENKNLKLELNGALGDNLQSSHTKSILFIFNLIVGIFLLIAVIWMFMRKKSESAPRSFSNMATSTFSATTNVDGYDHKLERIEKLGSLREKGLLTEDEFNLQKRQILGDRN